MYNFRCPLINETNGINGNNGTNGLGSNYQYMLVYFQRVCQKICSGKPTFDKNFVSCRIFLKRILSMLFCLSLEEKLYFHPRLLQASSEYMHKEWMRNKQLKALYSNLILESFPYSFFCRLHQHTGIMNYEIWSYKRDNVTRFFTPFSMILAHSWALIHMLKYFQISFLLF